MVVAAMRPSGDVFLEVNTTVEVICYITNHTSLLRADNLTFVRQQTHLPSQWQVVDNYTISLALSEAVPTTYNLYCFGGDSFCGAKVKVGYKPLDVENFECVSYNWLLLHCTWSLPNNPAQDAVYKPYLLSSTSSGAECSPSDSCQDLQTCCQWQPPEYSQSDRHLSVIFDTSNSLDSEVVKFNHTFDNYAIVLPNAALNVVVTSVDGSLSAEVNWSLPAPMDVFNTNCGIVSLVDYRLQQDPWIVGATGECQKARCWTVVQLDHWWTEYEVRVRLRSAAANFTLDDDGWWSSGSSTTTLTPSAVPEVAPAVGPGTFLVTIRSLQQRDLTFTWRPVPTLLHNAPDFTYFVSASVSATRETVANATVMDTFVTFTNLSTSQSYRLEVVGQNSEGMGQERSWVQVWATRDMPQVPTLPVVIIHQLQQQQLYELRWSGNGENDTHSTVYLCTDGLNTKQPCKADIYWLTVGELTSVNLTLADFNLTDADGGSGVRFGVSVEAVESGASSGMSWDTCTIPRVYSTALTPPTVITPIDVTDTMARIEWSLDCDNWAGVVEAIETIYCTGYYNLSQDCFGEVQVESEVWLGEVKVRHLAPETLYTVWLRVTYRAGTSQWSPAQNFTTDNPPGRFLVHLITHLYPKPSSVRLRNSRSLVSTVSDPPSAPVSSVRNGVPSRSHMEAVDGGRGVALTSHTLHQAIESSDGSPEDVTRSTDVSAGTSRESNRDPGVLVPYTVYDVTSSQTSGVPSSQTSGVLSSQTSGVASSQTSGVASSQTSGVASSQTSSTLQDSGYVVPIFPDDTLSPPPIKVSSSLENLTTMLMNKTLTSGYVAVEPRHFAAEASSDTAVANSDTAVTSSDTAVASSDLTPHGTRKLINLDDTETSGYDITDPQHFWSESIPPGTGYVAVPPPDFGTLPQATDIASHDRAQHRDPQSWLVSTPEKDSSKKGYIMLDFLVGNRDDHPSSQEQASSPTPLLLAGERDSGDGSCKYSSQFAESMPYINFNEAMRTFTAEDAAGTVAEELTQLLSVAPSPGYVAIQPPDFGAPRQCTSQDTLEDTVHDLASETHRSNEDKIILNPKPVMQPLTDPVNHPTTPTLLQVDPGTSTRGFNKGSGSTNEASVDNIGAGSSGYVALPIPHQVQAWDALSSDGCPRGSIDTSRLITGQHDPSQYLTTRPQDPPQYLTTRPQDPPQYLTTRPQDPPQYLNTKSQNPQEPEYLTLKDLVKYDSHPGTPVLNGKKTDTTLVTSDTTTPVTSDTTTPVTSDTTTPVTSDTTTPVTSDTTTPVTSDTTTPVTSDGSCSNESHGVVLRRKRSVSEGTLVGYSRVGTSSYS
nr:uncharacterized protein LOC128704501 [Cherax quadricarinatus]